MPKLFEHLADDAAVVPSGGGQLREALTAHRGHRRGWYADLIGPLLVPASTAVSLPGLVAPGERLAVGLVADGNLADLAHTVRAVTDRAAGPAGTARTAGPAHPLRPGSPGRSGHPGAAGEALAGPTPDDRRAPGAEPSRIDLVQVEAAVAKRGEDPQPGLNRLLALLAELPQIGLGYAEIPLTWGLLAALDTIGEARAAGAPIAVKFRVSGLAAELFPTPVELAAVICACRDRELPFKLTTGAHRAVRYTDPETGFAHHGFANVLVGTLAATAGAEVAEVAELLALTSPRPLVDTLQAEQDRARPLWRGFGASGVAEVLTDLYRLGLLEPGPGQGGPELGRTGWVNPGISGPWWPGPGPARAW